ncbi:MAG: hypothetical protein D3910_19115 [Candidatus Electrothrix sp. ATG2]|nr:hypothetical protein [Candidatus Electrothrix sp. ATG2]
MERIAGREQECSSLFFCCTVFCIAIFFLGWYFSFIHFSVAVDSRQQKRPRSCKSLLKFIVLVEENLNILIPFL